MLIELGQVDVFESVVSVPNLGKSSENQVMLVKDGIESWKTNLNELLLFFAGILPIDYHSLTQIVPRTDAPHSKKNRDFDPLDLAGADALEMTLSRYRTATISPP